MEEPETTSSDMDIELSMVGTTEENEDVSNAVDDTGTSPPQAPPSEGPARQPTDGWRQRFLPDLARAARPRALQDLDTDEEEDEDCGSTGDHTPDSDSNGADSDSAEGVADLSGAKMQTRRRRFKTDKAWAGMGAPPANLTPPTAAVPPGCIKIASGRTSRTVNVPSAPAIPRGDAQPRAVRRSYVLPPPATAWAGMSAPPSDLDPPAAHVPPAYVHITAQRTQSYLFLSKAFMRDFVCAGAGLPFPLRPSVKACMWAEGPHGHRAFSSALSKKDRGDGKAVGFQALGEYLGVYDAAEDAELEFQYLGSAHLPGGPEFDRVYHFSVKKSSAGGLGGKQVEQDAAAAVAAQDHALEEGSVEQERRETASDSGAVPAPPVDLTPPAAAVPPAFLTVGAGHNYQTLNLGRSFVSNFFGPGAGLAVPLAGPVELSLWAEGASGRVAFRRKLSKRSDTPDGGTMAFKPLGRHMEVFDAPQASTLEFRHLGSAPLFPGRPDSERVYHLSVKKITSGGADNNRAHASAASPIKKTKPPPASTPAPATATPLAKKTRAPLPHAAKPPTKKPKTASTTAPPVPAPAVAAKKAAKPESSALTVAAAAALPALHPLLLKTCAQGFSEIEQIAQGFASAPAGAPPADGERQQRLDIASLAVAAGRAQELWPGSGIYVNQGIHGLLEAATPEWGGTAVPAVSESLLRSLQGYRAGISDSLGSLLQGRPPHRLWVGPLGDGSSGAQVITLGAIPAGSWVLQVPGEYLFGVAAVNAASHPSVRHFSPHGGGVSGGGCVAPLVATTTPERREICLNGAIGRFEGDHDPRWRRLGEAALDFSGTVAALLAGSAADSNLEVVEMDLPTGPTGVFLVACRDILPGERLVAALG